MDESSTMSHSNQDLRRRRRDGKPRTSSRRNRNEADCSEEQASKSSKIKETSRRRGVERTRNNFPERSASDGSGRRSAARSPTRKSDSSKTRVRRVMTDASDRRRRRHRDEDPPRRVPLGVHSDPDGRRSTRRVLGDHSDPDNRRRRGDRPPLRRHRTAEGQSRPRADDNESVSPRKPVPRRNRTEPREEPGLRRNQTDDNPSPRKPALRRNRTEELASSSTRGGIVANPNHSPVRRSIRTSRRPTSNAAALVNAVDSRMMAALEDIVMDSSNKLDNLHPAFPYANNNNDDSDDDDSSEEDVLGNSGSSLNDSKSTFADGEKKSGKSRGIKKLLQSAPKRLFKSKSSKGDNNKPETMDESEVTYVYDLDD